MSPESPRVAIVVGASGGIGAEVARRLASRSIAVVVAARRLTRLSGLVSEIQSNDGSAMAVPFDITATGSPGELLDQTIARFGRVDYAVNAAGLAGGAPFTEYPMEEFDNMLAVNVRGAFSLMKALIPSMLESGGGSIVNVASLSGITGIPGVSGYATSKHALVGLTRSVAAEFAGTGVRVNAVAPGPVDTEMLDNAPQQTREALIRLSPENRMSTVSETTATITHLLLDATSTSGAIVPINFPQIVS